MPPRVCSVKIDRVQFIADMPEDGMLPLVPGFRTLRNTYVRAQTAIRTYSRVQTLQNRKSGTKVFEQYKTPCPWLPDIKGTVVGVDHSGLRPSELRDLLERFPNYRLLSVETALDFSAQSRVNQAFVKRHGRFGRSRPQARHRFPQSLRIGTRKSYKLVRCYPKPAIGSFRVELEFHGSWLRRHRIQTFKDLQRLPALLYPAHIYFVEIDLDYLRRHLLMRGLPVTRILRLTKKRAKSIHAVTTYLRREVGLTNVHRFLQPIPINRQVYRALKEWAQRWR